MNTEDQQSKMHLLNHLISTLYLCFFIIPPSYSKCPPSFPCRNFTLQFPFTDIKYPDCGLFKVHYCNNDTKVDHPRPRVDIGSGGSFYEILGKVSTNKFLIQDLGLQNALSSNECYSFSNMSLLHSPSVSFTFSPNLTFFTCYNYVKEGIQKSFQSYKTKDCEISTVYYKTPAAARVAACGAISTLPGCVVTQLPLKSENISGDLFYMLSANFSLEWSVSEDCFKCFHGGGHCLHDKQNKLYCKQGNRTKKIFFIGGMTIAALASTLMILFFSIRRKRAKARQKCESDIELFLKKNGNLAPMRYRYSSIKKMTNSFSVTLGKGGCGSVYKGQFTDGHLVAVKLLNESNGNGEEFMNEVASISRTSHINIVSLLGFCFEGPKRALIYDFMPNGSLEKFIGNAASAAPAESELGWDKLFEIALGIARGLEYLHQGCNTRILHLDIKPQNILLDKDFNPRISDFGLAKLCPNRSSIVSMMVARGTIGYIAPEVFSRNFGDISYKSDVYSYGMLVLEMVGGRKNIDPRDIDHTSEIYFPHYIYKQLEMNAERDLGGIVVEDEIHLLKRNLMIVGLWCIQTNAKDRPSMTKVVEMLEGRHGSILEVPPKPYLYSPPRSAPISISTSDSM